MKSQKKRNRGRDWEVQHPPIYVNKDIVDAVRRDVAYPSENAHIEDKIKFLLDCYNEDRTWYNKRMA